MGGVPEPPWEPQDYLEDTTPDQSVLDPWEIADGAQTESKQTTSPTEDDKTDRSADDHDVFREEDVLSEAALAEPAKLLPEPLDLSFDNPDGLDDLNPDETQETYDFDDEIAVETHSSSDQAFIEPDITDELFDYDPQAHQQPWEDRDAGHHVDENATRRARGKAAIVASLLDVTNRQEQKTAVSWLIELFLQQSHPATFRAVKEAASDGLTPAQLRAMIALRLIWAERPDWWVGRYGLSRDIRLLRPGSATISWRLAQRICSARCDYEPEDMIDDGWFDEWLALPRGIPGYPLFAAYVDTKVSDMESQLLYEGLSQCEEDAWQVDTGDDFGWWRKVPNQDEAIRYGFNVWTPPRDPFEPPGYVEWQRRSGASRNET
ncbi:MAG: hypothetical protein WA446_08890 [Steroidobacteraceae bacterium]